MSKQQVFVLVAILVLGYILSLGGSYFMLKGKTTDQNQMDSIAAADSLATLAKERGLDLTIDISQPESSVPAAESTPDSTLASVEKQSEEMQKQEATVFADSIVTAKTEPMQQELQIAQTRASEAEAEVNDLKTLLANLSAGADSLDQTDAKRLSRIIEAMQPVDAAAVMITLGDETSARLLITIKQRQAAKILAAMPRDRAAQVARYLSRAYEKSAI